MIFFLNFILFFTFGTTIMLIYIAIKHTLAIKKYIINHWIWQFGPIMQVVWHVFEKLV